MFTTARLQLNHDRLPRTDYRIPEIKRTVFVLPEWVTKNKEARVVVLNDVAQRIIDGVRGQHPTYVFTWVDRKGRRHRFARLNNSGWKAARRRAAARYQEELGRAAPRDSGVFGCTISGTHAVVDYGRLVWAWRIGRTSWATRAAASRPTTAFRRSAISLRR